MLDRFIADAEDLLPSCVLGLRAYWRRRGAGFPVPPTQAPSALRH
jgi:hypothetical protein